MSASFFNHRLLPRQRETLPSDRLDPCAKPILRLSSFGQGLRFLGKGFLVPCESLGRWKRADQMSFFSWLGHRQKPVVGVDIGTSSIKVVDLKRHSEGYKLESLGIKKLPPGAVVEGVVISKQVVAQIIDRIFKAQKINNNRVATSVGGHSVIVKRLEVPRQSDRELEDSIRWEGATARPFQYFRGQSRLSGVGRLSPTPSHACPFGGSQTGQDRRTHSRLFNGGQTADGGRRRCFRSAECFRIQLPAPSPIEWQRCWTLVPA